MSRISVTFFAGAAEAFGGSETTLEDVGTLTEAVAVLSRDGDDRFREVLAQCSFFVDGEHHRSLDVRLPSDCKVDVLPPFAGG